MDRFYVNHPFQAQPFLDDMEEIKHITKVLRFSVGDCVEIFDSEQGEFIAKILSVDSKRIYFDIQKEFPKSQTNISITLYQGIAKGHRMEFLIQKSTELGVDEIIPVRFQRSVAKLETDDKKIQRWNKICLEASKQSKRNKISCVKNAIDFDDLLLKLRENDLNLFFYEEEHELTLKSYLENQVSRLSDSKYSVKIGIIVGPEGGFTEEEKDILVESGIPALSLGKRILRTETVSMAVLSMLQYEFEL